MTHTQGHATIAQCLIDNAPWPSVRQQGAGVDEDAYATLRAAYGQLLGEMPHERALFEPDQLVYWVGAQLATPRWMEKQREYGLR